MMYEELVKQLREYANEYEHGTPTGDTFADAAAAIEHLMRVHWQDEALIEASEETIKELQAEVKRLELDNEDYEYTLRERYNETITLEQAIDRLHELGWLQEHDRILTEPKRGKWEPFDKTKVRCTSCGAIFGNAVVDLYQYCPMCGSNNGAKMEVQDGQ